MSNQPVKKFRIGFLTATIWKNERNGKDWYSVDVFRTYKDGDDELKNTGSLNHADLLNAACLLTKAEAWIAEQ